jgi:hypothetical protein
VASTSPGHVERIVERMRARQRGLGPIQARPAPLTKLRLQPEWEASETWLRDEGRLEGRTLYPQDAGPSPKQVRAKILLPGENGSKMTYPKQAAKMQNEHGYPSAVFRNSSAERFQPAEFPVFLARLRNRSHDLANGLRDGNMLEK